MGTTRAANSWQETQLASVQRAAFDSNLMNLMIRDGASAGIMNDKSDSMGKMRKVCQCIKGIAGHTHTSQIGTVQWPIDDDKGRTLMIQVKNTYFMEQVPNHIFSPQHFTQVVNNHNPEPEGTGSTTDSKNITSLWGQRTCTKTLPLV